MLHTLPIYADLTEIYGGADRDTLGHMHADASLLAAARKVTCPY